MSKTNATMLMLGMFAFGPSLTLPQLLSVRQKLYSPVGYPSLWALVT